MGTNYYWYPHPACACCGREFTPLHIGKSSQGWTFGLHVFADGESAGSIAYQPQSLDDWRELFALPGSVIKNEYGEVFSAGDMIGIITDRQWIGRGLDGEPPDYYDSWEQMFRENHAQPGPNGLLRSKIEYGYSCVGHGDGTWDYVTGDFS